MALKADAVADLVLTTFRHLPPKFKPRSVERREWVPIAGIVLSKVMKDNESKNHHEQSSLSPTVECVALATGMKCHPHSRLPRLQGYGLHDSHAEILALRAFNRFLLHECADLAASGRGRESKWLHWQRETERLAGEPAAPFPQPFKLRDDVAIHMYCSEAPCGDASMELTMAKQADATPWALPFSPSNPSTIDNANGALLHGRGHFDLLGTVRRKPSRPDAPPTLSKSCTDKLALKECTGLLSSLTALLIWPGNVYLTDMVIPASEYVPEAWERALGSEGRMAKLKDILVQARWRKDGFKFMPFKVLTTEREFEFSNRSLSRESNDGTEPVPSNRSCVYIRPDHSETLINGVLEGRKWYEPRGASELSRRSMWQEAARVAKAVDTPILMRRCSYAELKTSQMSQGREQVKADVRELALQGWRRNDGDDEWTLNDEEWAKVNAET